MAAAKPPDSTDTKITRDSGLVDKLAHIISELPQLQKKGWNAGQKFNFISVEQMKKEILPRCAALGIVMYPKAIERSINYRDRINKEGSVYGLSTEIQLTVTWIVTDGTDSIEVVAVGEAIDVQDKAANKASTGAQKNLFKTLFGVTEEDEDNDSLTPVPRGESTRLAQPPKTKASPPLTDAQKELLQLKDQAYGEVDKLAKEKGIESREVIEHLANNEFIPKEFVDARNMKHRDQYKELLAGIATFREQDPETVTS